MREALRLSGICKTYRTPSPVPWRRGRTVAALREVSFACPAQGISCLLGPNGAGKTTIIKILAGLVLADRGTALVNGIPLGKPDRAGIGVATPNDRSFYWRLTGRQNLQFFASLSGLGGGQRAARVREAAGAAGLDQAVLDRRCMEYSAGMKQKLLLARALLGRPGLLLLDEPSSHLDPPARAAMHSLITRLVRERGTTILLSTHDLAEAQELSDRLIVLNEGRVAADGSLADLRARLSGGVRLVIEFAQPPEPGWMDGIAGIVESGAADHRIAFRLEQEGHVPDVLRAAVSHGGRVLGAAREEVPLAEIMARLARGSA